ncbi:MAG: hypothetical protein LW601_05845 [Cryomorphaceae bacterium]|nr:hypothetical protein [Cryomorphaceae bacterium]
MNKFWMGAPALFLAACAGGDLVPVSLEVPETKEVVVFRIDADQLVPWDPVAVADGMFDTELPLDSSGATFYALSLDNGASLRLGIERGDDIEGKVSVVGSGITDYSVTGSALSERLQAHYMPLRHTALLMDTLEQEAKAHQGMQDAAEHNAQLFMRYEARITKHRDELIKLVKEEPASLANIFALYQSAGNFYLFDPQRDSALFRTTADAMSEAHPEHPILKVFIQSAIR